MSESAEIAALGGHSQAHHEALYVIALSVFVGVVLLLGLLYRRSCGRVEMEEIDAMLRDENVL